MRIASTGFVALALAVMLPACSAPVPTQTTRRAGTNSSSAKDKTQTTEDEVIPSDDGTPETPDPDPTPTPTESDGDGDGIPDATDCDPASAALAGTKLLDDGLLTDKGYFGAAAGFPQASWAYDAAYRQTRVVDAADASFFLGDATIGDVIAEVRTASTEVAAITPRLRQMFIVVGATVSGGQLSALGCGIEVVGGEATEQKTSVVRLTGAPGAVSTTPLQRVNRAAVQIDEELSIKARLAQGMLTCEVTNGGVTTTATASGLGTPTGSVGLFTRQTKALFKQARICKLK